MMPGQSNGAPVVDLHGGKAAPDKQRQGSECITGDEVKHQHESGCRADDYA
jgi:hypothetical protein